MAAEYQVVDMYSDMHVIELSKPDVTLLLIA